MPEPAIGIIATDNLEIACTIVERVAMERAISEIDEALASALLMRRKHREQTTAPFWDSSAMPTPQYTHLLPDPLRLKPKGLSPAQEQVYGDFARIRPAVSDGPLVADTQMPMVDARAQGYGQVTPGPAYTVQQAFEKFVVCYLYFFRPDEYKIHVMCVIAEHFQGTQRRC